MQEFSGMFLASNFLNLAELVVDELMKKYLQKFTNIAFCIRFITD